MEKVPKKEGRPCKNKYDARRMQRVYDVVRQFATDDKIKDINTEIALRMRQVLSLFFDIHTEEADDDSNVKKSRAEKAGSYRSWLIQMSKGTKASVDVLNLWALIYSLWPDFYDRIRFQKNGADGAVLNVHIAGAICARMHYSTHLSNFDEGEKVKELVEARKKLEIQRRKLNKLAMHKKRISKVANQEKRQELESMLPTADEQKKWKRIIRKSTNLFNEKKENFLQKRGYGIYSAFFDSTQKVPSTEWLFVPDFAIDLAEMLDNLCGLQISFEEAENLAFKINMIFEEQGLSHKSFSAALMEFNDMFGFSAYVPNEAVFSKILLEIFGTVYTQRHRFKGVV